MSTIRFWSTVYTKGTLSIEGFAEFLTNIVIGFRV